MISNKMPDFLIIGAAKSGTTSLYYYLRQHPKIFMPQNKEPSFFSLEGKNLGQFHFEGHNNTQSEFILGIEQYQNLFRNAAPFTKKGEASTIYLYDEDTPKKILHYIPSGKLIAILRNPIDRAYSNFNDFRRKGFEPLRNFADAIKAEPRRIKENWFNSYYYVDRGLYSRQLRNYYNYFPKTQIKIFLYEDLKETEKVVRDIFQFLGIDPDVPIHTNIKYNISGNLRFPRLYKWARQSHQAKQFLRNLLPWDKWTYIKGKWDSIMLTKIEPIPDEIHDQLLNFFLPDIIDLQDLINRDLSHWMIK